MLLLVQVGTRTVQAEQEEEEEGETACCSELTTSFVGRVAVETGCVKGKEWPLVSLQGMAADKFCRGSRWASCRE